MTRSLATTRPGILSIITLTLLASAACLDAAERGSPNTRWTTIGPPVGTLLIDGGHDQGKAKDAFLSLVGDPEALIVVIPTAGADEACEEDSPTIEALRQRGAKNVKVLHTRRRAVANTDEFVAPLKEAKGVWMAGGRQSRLAKAYLHTLTHRELFGVLERGGVIAGTSAGASIQGSYLYGGQSAGEVGFGFVRDAAIGQHFVRRRRHLPETSGLPKVVARNPGLLGIGIDEETFIIVRGDVFTVGGYGKVAIADATRPNWPGEEPHEFFIPGDAYDMKQRRAIVHRASNAENQWDGAKKEWVDPTERWETVGPPKGTLLLGGASPTTRIMRRFIELAGGREARIVVLPTADARHRERIHRDLALLRKLGATNVQLLHSIDRDTANSRAFVEPLRKADAAWILDGDPWRLADAYLHTLVHKELFDLLDRGGIVAGSGGGARFLAHHMSGDEYGWVRGCGLLKRSAVDTWPSDKRRIDQMVASLKNDRSLLGIGIDDKTALVVRGNRFESLGDGEVALFNAIPGGWPWEEDESHLLLEPGGRYDLETRRPEWMTEWPPAADRLFGRCLDDQNADL